MMPIASIGSSYAPPPLLQVSAPETAEVPKTQLGGAAPTDTFGQMFDHLVSSVDAKQNEASQITQSVLTGNSGQLHQSVIAMQEASVSFALMVEVRNKLVESYQELMRMQA